MSFLWLWIWNIFTIIQLILQMSCASVMSRMKLRTSLENCLKQATAQPQLSICIKCILNGHIQMMNWQTKHKFEIFPGATGTVNFLSFVGELLLLTIMCRWRKARLCCASREYSFVVSIFLVFYNRMLFGL